MLDPIIPSRIVVPEGLPEITSEDIAIHTIKTLVGVINARRAVNSFGKGVMDSIEKAMTDKFLMDLLPGAMLAENLYNTLCSQDFPNSVLGEVLPLYSPWSPTEELMALIAENETRIQALAEECENKNAYYIGRCVGDIAAGVGGILEIYGGFSTSIAGIRSLVPASAGGPYGIAISVTAILGGVAIAVDGTVQAVHAYGSLVRDMGRYQESRAEDEEAARGKKNSDSKLLKTADDISEKARNGNLKRGKNYHGRLEPGLEQEILADPDAVYVTNNNKQNLVY